MQYGRVMQCAEWCSVRSVAARRVMQCGESDAVCGVMQCGECSSTESDAL